MPALSRFAVAGNPKFCDRVFFAMLVVALAVTPATIKTEVRPQARTSHGVVRISAASGLFRAYGLLGTKTAREDRALSPPRFSTLNIGSPMSRQIRRQLQRQFQKLISRRQAIRTRTSSIQNGFNYGQLEPKQLLAAVTGAESGRLTNLTDQWQTVNLAQHYINPVVVAGPSSFAGSNTVSVRIRNVDFGSFEIRVDEWDYQDEIHGARETVGYLVMEAGTHTLDDGTIVHAGKQSVSTWFKTVNTGGSGVVLTSFTSENDSATVTTRVRNVGSNFEVKLQEEEGADGIHSAEEVSWIQFEMGTGNSNGIDFVAAETPQAITSFDYSINYGHSFASPPVFLATMQTAAGYDPATVRTKHVGNTGSTIFLEEEVSRDSETYHLAERVGYLAMTAGVLSSTENTTQEVGEAGTVSVTGEWKTVQLGRNYHDMVVVAGPASRNDASPVTIQIRHVATNSFDIRVKEWDYLDGVHETESVDYLVMEAGEHTLANGTIIRAGNQQVGTTFETVESGTGNGMLFTSVVSDNDSGAVITRVRNLQSRFEVKLQEEQAADGIHADETVSWIQIETGKGSVNGLHYTVIDTTQVVTHENYNVAFDQSFGGTPVLLASMQSYAGGDPATVRRSSLTQTAAGVFAEEERSGDNEVVHNAEKVGILAIEPGIISVLLTDSGGIAALPILPKEFVDTTWAAPTGGQTWNVNQGDDLQAVLNSAMPGDTIVLQAGATFTGNFLLPDKTDTPEGGDWIYIVSSELDQLPEGERVGPADAIHMPKIVSPNSNPALVTDFGTDHYRIAGIEFSTEAVNYNLILLGFGLDNDTDPLWTLTRANTLEKLPHHITFDRTYIHSTSDTNPARTGILADGIHIAVMDSYISNFKDTADAQAIAIWGGQGPYKIVNNYLEASGENILFGGESISIEGAIPSDIEIRGNHFFKPLAWKDPDVWQFKNLLEFKIGQRIHVRGNVFENSWVDGQKGAAVLFTVRNQTGNSPWSVVRDVTFENNVIRHVGQGIVITGEDDAHPSQQTERILIENNLIEDVTRELYANTRFLSFSTPNRPILDLTIRNNLFLHALDEVGYQAARFEGSRITVDRFVCENNIFTHGDYGFAGVDTHATNYSFKNNGIIFDPGEREYNYFLNNFDRFYPENLKADLIADVEFADLENGDYHLEATSPFKNAGTNGEDLGPVVDALFAAIDGVVDP